MGFLDDILGFEKFKLGNMWDKVKKNPEQLLLGAGDPASAKLWSGVTGKKYEPLVDQWGGATKDDYSKAEASGIDTGAGRKMHGVARGIAGIFAGKYAMGRAGVGADGSTSPGGTTAGQGRGISFPQQLDFGQEQEHDGYVPPPAPVDVIDLEPIEAGSSTYIVSDKARKRPAKGGVQRAIQRGLDGENPIDENGVQLLLIQALADKIELLQKRVAQLKQSRGE